MGKLHVFFFPLVAHGHMIPTLDMAKLFTSRGVKTTIIATPPFVEPIELAISSGFEIGIRVIKFPPEGSGLPVGIVSFDQITSDDLLPQFVKATCLLQQPVEQLLRECRPGCLVADMFFPWATDSAAKFGIPRLVFHGISFISLCGLEHLRRYKPFKNVSSDSEPFVVPNLPHELKFTRTQVAYYDREEIESDYGRLIKQAKESEWRSYGVLVNSFYELEPDYADHYRKVLGRKAWHIGPLLLCSRNKAERGDKKHECLEWLSSKRQDSVVYLCFGSTTNFTPAQLHEIAKGLEASGQDFMWVVRKGKDQDNDEEKWMPEGFEERVKGKGFIIRGWAPQVLILEHEAIGAFVTHCGWNSILEGVCAGKPMVTWPVSAEQFFNEKLVTEVLRTGVPVGNKKWQRVASEGVTWEAIANAVSHIMVGEEAPDMRRRAKEYKDLAIKAVEEGGSSYNDTSNLIQELSAFQGPGKTEANGT